MFKQRLHPHKNSFKNFGFSTPDKKSKEFGIGSSILDINWNAALDRKNRVVKNLRIGLENLLASREVNIINGKGIITGPNQVSINTESEDILINFEKLIIATGSTPLLPNIPGIELDGVITSTEALELNEIPKSIAIIGVGAIGLEFASMFNSAGTKVTVIEMKDRILPSEDNEVTTELMKTMKRQGISFKLSSTVKKIAKAGEF